MFLTQLEKITTFIFDVDGVLTNGDIIASDSGEYLRTFNIKDGYALQLAVKKGYQVAIISGGSGQAMQKRFEGLGITEIFLGVADKVAVYQQLVVKYQLEPEQILYMGDDIPDFKVMQLVGLPTCPADAVPEIKAISKYISPYNGGKTAVRDVVEKVLRVQHQWFDANPSAADSGK
ncbi:HAD family hydrolase [Pedobacter sp. MC2016-24]|uniref:KdsC family phosphatase n=1 Tax=Pedobacter sp. MC2016-24 TaxID=2780090 RepID=UPI00187E5B4E|nr:HAD-IIIA family hydrolase [Pedobacter sp. MC2016-24]MBE9602056.1 HAD-IIIA family hydrolase [Pedobacter sp. MC2016-24]